MRDPERIKPMLEKINIIWQGNPDLRLGQLVTVLAGDADSFNIEDDQLSEQIDAFIDKASTPKSIEPISEMREPYDLISPEFMQHRTQVPMASPEPKSTSASNSNTITSITINFENTESITLPPEAVPSIVIDKISSKLSKGTNGVIHGTIVDLIDTMHTADVIKFTLIEEIVNLAGYVIDYGHRDESNIEMIQNRNDIISIDIHRQDHIETFYVNWHKKYSEENKNQKNSTSKYGYTFIQICKKKFRSPKEQFKDYCKNHDTIKELSVKADARAND